MKLYELTYLISPDLFEKDLRNFQEKIISLIQGVGGSLNKVNEPTRKSLAYLVKNKSEAYLATLNFYLDSEKMGSLEKKLRAEERILRYTIILTKPRPKEVLVSGKKLPPAKPSEKPKVKPETKVELKEIEKKLEEILGE